MWEKTAGGVRIAVEQGDFVSAPCNGLVCPVTLDFDMHMGPAAAMRELAGPAVELQAMYPYPSCGKIGHTSVTIAGNTKANRIIHVAVYDTGLTLEAASTGAAAAVQEAADRGLPDVVMPDFGQHVDAPPIYQRACAMIKGIESVLNGTCLPIEAVRIVLPDPYSLRIFGHALTGRPLRAPDIPNDQIVCTCSGTTKGQVMHAVAGGVKNLKNLTNATGAGLCRGRCENGCCRASLQELLNLYVPSFDSLARKAFSCGS